MRINISKSKNHEFIYIIRDIYNNGSRTTKIHKKLGKIEDPSLEVITMFFRTSF